MRAFGACAAADGALAGNDKPGRAEPGGWRARFQRTNPSAAASGSRMNGASLRGQSTAIMFVSYDFVEDRVQRRATGCSVVDEFRPERLDDSSAAPSTQPFNDWRRCFAQHEESWRGERRLSLMRQHLLAVQSSI